MFMVSNNISNVYVNLFNIFIDKRDESLDVNRIKQNPPINLFVKI